MSNFPARGTIKSRNVEDYDDNNQLDDCLKLIQQLWQSRLIDHISRPIDRKVKLEHIQIFRVRLVGLHQKLRKIMNEASQKSSQRNTKGKSNVGMNSIRPKDWSKYIRGIQNRYSQVLVQGSFKYFRKVCTMLDLKYDSDAMQPINIERWSTICLNQKTQDSCC